jgi:hypothetical protein
MKVLLVTKEAYQFLQFIRSDWWETRRQNLNAAMCSSVLQLHLQRTSVSEGESWEHPTKPPFLPQDLIEQDRYVRSAFFLFTSFQQQRKGAERKSRRLHQGEGEVAGWSAVGGGAEMREVTSDEPGHGGLPGAWGRTAAKVGSWAGVCTECWALGSSDKVGGATLRGPAFGLY